MAKRKPAESPEQDVQYATKRFPEPDPTKHGYLFVVKDEDGKTFVLWTDVENGLGIIRGERTELVEVVQEHLQGHAEAGSKVHLALQAVLSEVQRRNGSFEFFQGLLSDLTNEHQSKVD